MHEIYEILALTQMAVKCETKTQIPIHLLLLKTKKVTPTSCASTDWAHASRMLAVRAHALGLGILTFTAYMKPLRCVHKGPMRLTAVES